MGLFSDIKRKFDVQEISYHYLQFEKCYKAILRAYNDRENPVEIKKRFNEMINKMQWNKATINMLIERNPGNIDEYLSAEIVYVRSMNRSATAKDCILHIEDMSADMNDFFDEDLFKYLDVSIKKGWVKI